MIKAIIPYTYNGLNFKKEAYNAWKLLGFATSNGWYPRFLHWLIFRYDIFPSLWQNEKEKRLIFIQPVSLYFDAGISVLNHEIIPVIWDCWPCYYDKIEHWLKRHNVKTAFFTSSQEMMEIKRRLPDLNVFHCPEAVNTSLYDRGKELTERTIEILEFGRSNNLALNFSEEKFQGINRVNTSNLSKRPTDNEFRLLIQDAKVTICFPKSITHPDEAQGVETLTQRYWEAMLSRTVIVGHCPKELQELIGYNPVIELAPADDASVIILNIINNINQYQDLVNKNAEYALKFGDWQDRMQTIKQILSK